MFDDNSCRPTEAEELAKSREGARYQLKMLASETLGLFLNYAARQEAQHAFDLGAMLVGYGFSVSGEGFAPDRP